MLAELDADSLASILSYCSESFIGSCSDVDEELSITRQCKTIAIKTRLRTSWFEMESLQFTCRKLFRTLSGYDSPTMSSRTILEQVMLNEVYVSDSLKELKRKMFIPRVLFQLRIKDADSVERIVREWKRILGMDLIRLSLWEFELSFKFPSKEGEQHTILDRLEGLFCTDAEFPLNANNSLIRYEGPQSETNRKHHKTLRNHLSDWYSQYPNGINPHDMTLNACKISSEIIIHIQLVPSSTKLPGTAGRSVNIQDTIKVINTPKGPSIKTNTIILGSCKITDREGVQKYAISSRKNQGKIILYFLLKDCLISEMEKSTTINLRQLLDNQTLSIIKDKLKQNYLIRNKKLVDFLTIYFNIQRVYLNSILNGRITFQKLQKDKDAISIINHLSLLDFSSMNDKMRIHLLKVYLSTLYRNELNISDEVRANYSSLFKITSCEGFRPNTTKDNLLGLEFETLEFDQNYWKMKHNLVFIPKYPSVEFSIIQHQRPPSLRQFNLTSTGKVDKWCIENICSNRFLYCFNCASILCCWLSTCYCCYDIGSGFVSLKCNIVNFKQFEL